MLCALGVLACDGGGERRRASPEASPEESAPAPSLDLTVGQPRCTANVDSSIVRAEGDRAVEAQGQGSVEIDRTGRVEVSFVDSRLEDTPRGRAVVCLSEDETRDLLASAERIDMDRDERVGIFEGCLRALDFADGRMWRPQDDRCIGSEWIARVDLAGWRAARAAWEARPCADTFCAVEIRRGITGYGGHSPGSITSDVAIHADGRWRCDDVSGTMPAAQARAAIAWLMVGLDATNLHGPGSSDDDEEAALFVSVRAYARDRDGFITRYRTNRMADRLQAIERQLCGRLPQAEGHPSLR